MLFSASALDRVNLLLPLLLLSLLLLILLPPRPHNQAKLKKKDITNFGSRVDPKNTHITPMQNALPTNIYFVEKKKKLHDHF